MQNLKILEDLKFEVDDSSLPNYKQWVPTRDISSYVDYCYVIKYNRLPSKVYMNYKTSEYQKLLTYLKEQEFKILVTSSVYGRHSSTGVVLVNNDYGILVDIGDNTSPTTLVAEPPQCDFNTIERTANISIYFDMAEGLKIVDELQEQFKYIETFDDRGKILLFEKNEYNDIVLTPYPVKGYDLNINENYNNDFIDVHEKLLKWLPDFTTQNNKLVLFNGPPGTGKTNYLKYLLNNTPNIKKIYIPPNFVQSITDPSFFAIIKREKESLIIIEDAEKILVNREEQSDNSTISNLLNLCDGIMADILNFKIIATFNTDENRIDSALKRKGRMFMKYSFDKLSNTKAANLYKKVHGVELNTTADLTLAEIYNDENEFGKKKEERKIGFGI